MLPEEVRKSIKSLMYYLWSREFEDYMCCDEKEKEQHVMNDYNVVYDWLEGYDDE